jgi:hypothetical protein
MITTNIRSKLVGAAIGALAAPILLLLGAGTAQAIQDINDGVPGITAKSFNPQPGPPGIGDPGIRPPLVLDPGSKVGLGGPDTRPPHIAESPNILQIMTDQ